MRSRARFAAMLFFVTMPLSCHGGVQAIAPPVQAASPPRIEYRNTEYGFCFALPQSWMGYTIVGGQWNGSPLDGGAAIAGPMLLIRNPAWTAANPREDIPILVFTTAEWQRVQKEGIAVSAAPMGPTELGQNRRYVFALPARWNFDELPGWEEAEQVIQSKPLRAPCK